MVAGGATAADNGQGLCVQCNHAKQAPDWRAGPAPDQAGELHQAVTITPTGHRLTSTAPALPPPIIHKMPVRVHLYVEENWDLTG